jgi:hypothetical protein
MSYSRYDRPTRTRGSASWLPKTLISIGAVAIAAVVVAAIVVAAQAHAGMHCVRSHDETYLMPVKVGKTTTWIPETDTVCDEWVPNQTTTPSPQRS